MHKPEFAQTAASFPEAVHYVAAACPDCLQSIVAADDDAGVCIDCGGRNRLAHPPPLYKAGGMVIDMSAHRPLVLTTDPGEPNVSPRLGVDTAICRRTGKACHDPACAYEPEGCDSRPHIPRHVRLLPPGVSGRKLAVGALAVAAAAFLFAAILVWSARAETVETPVDLEGFF